MKFRGLKNLAEYFKSLPPCLNTERPVRLAHLRSASPAHNLPSRQGYFWGEVGGNGGAVRLQKESQTLHHLRKR